MRFPPPRTCVLALPLLLVGTGVTMAQTTTAAPPAPRANAADTVSTRTDDHGFNRGWLGLLGLAGLAGLGGLNRREQVLPGTTEHVSSRP